MKILHVLSQIEITGAEAYAVTLAEWQSENNCEVEIISNQLHIPTKISFISKKIHTNSFITRLSNIFFLRKHIKENKIHVIHCHSRAAVRVGYWATLGLPAVLISTIHGQQHSSLSKRIFDIYGQLIIAVCENVLTSLQVNFNMNPKKMVAIGNPVKMQDYFQTDPYKKEKIAIIARGTGPKGQRTKDLIKYTLPTLLEKFNDLNIEIIGGLTENLDQETNHLIYEINQKFKNRLLLMGFITNLHEKYSEYKLVLGAGRVPIESLSRGIPTYAIGEYCCEGLITSANYESAKKSNFGDIGPNDTELVLDYKKITTELVQILNNNSLTIEERKDLQFKIKNDFSLETVCLKILKCYENLILQKK